jgi:prephenate dehydratase
MGYQQQQCKLALRETENKTEQRKAANTSHALRKSKKDPKGNLDITRAASLQVHRATAKGKAASYCFQG